MKVIRVGDVARVKGTETNTISHGKVEGGKDHEEVVERYKGMDRAELE